MGKKGKWFSAVKKLFSSNSEEKQSKDDADKTKSKKRWSFGKSNSDPGPSAEEAARNAVVAQTEIGEGNMENEQNKHAYSVALAAATAAEAAAVAAQAAAEVVRLTTATTTVQGAHLPKSKEEIAAIKIQTAFRGYLARRALRALRGLVRLKSLVDGNAVKGQTTNSLRCIQAMTRVQTQIHSRRVLMEEEKKALQRQLQQEHEQELQKPKIGEDWDHSHQSKEKIAVSLQIKQEAAIRRERALAYAFSHQWRNRSSQTVTPMFADPGNPNWGWSWTERWMAARPWENRVAPGKETEDHASLKSAITAVRASVSRATSAQRPTPNKTGWQSPSTPPSRAPSVAGRIRPVSPRGSWINKDEDSRSITSLRSERPRRPSLGGSSVGDDLSPASTPAIPGYMQSTESARRKSRYRSPSSEKLEIPERANATASFAKKRLSFPVADKPNVRPPSPDKNPSERVRRHSDPPKMDVASLNDVAVP